MNTRKLDYENKVELNVCVVGLGYVGLVTGVCLADKGHCVTGVDIDTTKIEVLQNNSLPIYEPGLSELMLKNRERLNFTTDCSNAYRDADIIIIGVGTPENKENGAADLDALFKVVMQISESIEKECVVVIKSTVPVGTNNKVKELITAHLKADIIVHVVSNPEFLSQGTAIKDTLHATRIVIGVEDKYSELIMKCLYHNFDAPILITDSRSAELIKYASNDFLALKISYINEIANLCEIVGADIGDVVAGMKYDKRIGNSFLKPGIGYGGSCFPKDTKALSWLAKCNNYELKTVNAAIQVNEEQKYKLINKCRKYYPSFKGLVISVLGLTFKPNTDDLREAPSLVNIPVFLEEGAKVKAWDPLGAKNLKKIYPTEIEYCETIDETLKNSDICFIFTEWDEVKNYSIDKFVQLMRRPIVLDGRNCVSIGNKAPKLMFENIGKQLLS